MLKKIREYVMEWKMLEANDKVIAGVSGGADSICLLFVLLELQKEIPFELTVVHVNHGLRGEDADRDEAYVKEICRENGVVCVCYFENIELIAKKRKQSMEEAGREVRREAFYHTLETYHGTKIALAHHKNDNVETFLMNLARGSGLKGLGGMLPVNGNVIRPLLTVERREIEDYLKQRKIRYCTDETNKSDDYTRNRVRNHVIPYMEEQINSKVVQHIDEAMRQFRQMQEFVESQTEIYYKKTVLPRKGGFFVSLEDYRRTPDAVRPLLLKKVLKELTGQEKNITSVHLQSLMELFEKQTGRKLALPYQVEAKRSYEGIVLKLQEKERTFESIELKPETGVVKTCEWCGRKIQYRILENEERNTGYSEKIYTKWFDYDIIKDTVSVRTRKTGDYITIHEDGKRQKLKSYFINEKVPQEERDRIPLIAEGSHVLWIAGYRSSCAYRVSEHTKQILEIQIDKGENYGRKN